MTGDAFEGDVIAVSAGHWDIPPRQYGYVCIGYYKYIRGLPRDIRVLLTGKEISDELFEALEYAITASTAAFQTENRRLASSPGYVYLIRRAARAHAVVPQCEQPRGRVCAVQRLGFCEKYCITIKPAKLGGF